MLSIPKFFSIGSLICLCVACIDSNGPDDKSTFFDRTKVLSFWSDSLFPTQWANYSNSISNLNSEFTAAIADNQINETERISLIESLKQARILYVKVSALDFGPADNILYQAFTNTFPADTTKIQNNIQSGTANLNSVANLVTQGLPSLEYLFAKSSSFANSEAKTLAYTSQLVTKLFQETQTVNDGFQSAAFKSSFLAANGADINSSLTIAVNAFVKEFELLKNARIGIPLGKKTLGIQKPNQVEAFFTDYSLDLARSNWEGIKAMYFGGIGNGIDDYLKVVAKDYGSEPLDITIQNQITKIDADFEALATVSSLQVALISNQTELNTLYDDIVKMVVFWKADMTSVLGIQINYQDNDGD